MKAQKAEIKFLFTEEATFERIKEAMDSLVENNPDIVIDWGYAKTPGGRSVPTPCALQDDYQERLKLNQQCINSHGLTSDEKDALLEEEFQLELEFDLA